MTFASLLPSQRYPLDKQYAAQPQNWKNLLFSLRDTRVYLVDGNHVRNNFETDFALGGHGYIYPFIPMDEIWVEDTGSEEDIVAVVAHELTERILMRDEHLSYEDAHERSTRLERIMRSSLTKQASLMKQALAERLQMRRLQKSYSQPLAQPCLSKTAASRLHREIAQSKSRQLKIIQSVLQRPSKTAASWYERFVGGKNTIPVFISADDPVHGWDQLDNLQALFHPETLNFEIGKGTAEEHLLNRNKHHGTLKHLVGSNNPSFAIYDTGKGYNLRIMSPRLDRVNRKLSISAFLTPEHFKHEKAIKDALYQFSQHSGNTVTEEAINSAFNAMKRKHFLRSIPTKALLGTGALLAGIGGGYMLDKEAYLAAEDNTLRNTAIGATGLTAAALAAKKYGPGVLKNIKPCSAKCKGKACKTVCALKHIL